VRNFSERKCPRAGAEGREIRPTKSLSTTKRKGEARWSDGHERKKKRCFGGLQSKALVHCRELFPPRRKKDRGNKFGGGEKEKREPDSLLLVEKAQDDIQKTEGRKMKELPWPGAKKKLFCRVTRNNLRSRPANQKKTRRP